MRKESNLVSAQSWGLLSTSAQQQEGASGTVIQESPQDTEMFRTPRCSFGKADRARLGVQPQSCKAGSPWWQGTGRRHQCQGRRLPAKALLLSLQTGEALTGDPPLPPAGAKTAALESDSHRQDGNYARVQENT